MTLWMYVIAAAVGLIGSALFAGFENGMISIRKARLDHAVEEGSFPAKLIRFLLDRPALMLAAVLLGTNLSHSLTSGASGRIAESIMGTHGTGAEVNRLAFSAILSAFASAIPPTIVILIFCEIVPKVWYRQRPFQRCRATVLPVFLFFVISFPFVWAMTAVVHLLHKLFPRGRGSDILLLRQDFRQMLRESESDGKITPETRLLLENSLEFDQQSVRGMMIPRSVVHALPADTPLEKVVELGRDTDVSRYPVYAENAPSQWTGIFSVYDAIFRIPREKWATETIGQHIRPLVTVDEKDDASQVVRVSNSSRSPLLVVLDDDKKQVGIITPTDIVRPLFGNLDL
jgi:putative hemolysin